MPRKLLAAQTKVSVDYKNIQKTMSVGTVDMGVQEEQMVQNSVFYVDNGREIGSPVNRAGNDRVTNSRANSDFGLWRGHEVNSEFVCLLDLIMNKYPQTFEHFNTKNNKLCTMKLNMLCNLVNDFTKITMTEVDTVMIAECREVFSGLQNFGFNISWLVSRLNYIEQLRFSQPPFTELHATDCCHIDDAKGKITRLADLY